MCDFGFWWGLFGFCPKGGSEDFGVDFDEFGWIEFEIFGYE